MTKQPDSGDLRAAFEALGEGARSREDCPAAGALWDAAGGVSSPPEISAVVLHTATCPSCARAWRMAVDVSRQAAASELEQEVPLTREEPAAIMAGWRPSSRRAPRAGSSRRSFRRLLPASLVALLLVGLGGGALYRNWWSHNAERGSGPELVIENLLPEGERLSADRFLLRWQGPPGASWEVTVMTEDLSRIVARASGVDETEYLVPPADLAGLESGALLLWRVVASLESGSKLPSPTFRATLE